LQLITYRNGDSQKCVSRLVSRPRPSLEAPSLGIGYRSAGSDTIRTERWVCNISSTVMVVMQTCLTV